ncbi:MAG: adenosylcobinamide-phosphate synthase CbiB [Halioglobus sp.]|nr:adenosylcobinamide-phosphate synthase CbiB [Halioglobus sp.]
MFVILMLALLLDRLAGEVSRGHPLIVYGDIATWVEGRARARFATPAQGGGVAWVILVVLPALLLMQFLSWLPGWLALLTDIAVLYFCVGMRSLEEHARAIQQPLLAGDLGVARSKLARIVSRDTTHLDEQSVAAGAVESVLENGSDAVIAPLFWFVVAGAPGALAYRLANTLDAMWGYRDEAYLHFGRSAALMDDVLNWIPARFCAFFYALAGHYHRARDCWSAQGSLWDSPNAGPVMAAGAGALGIRLGGPAVYGGILRERPVLGEGAPAQARDIEAALQLLRRAVGVGLLFVFAGGILL